MSTLAIKDAAGTVRYLDVDGSGTELDPFIQPGFIADETNLVSEQLKNGSSIDQNVDGSVTEVVFSSTPVPAGKVFIAARIIFYMESSSAMNSDLFGDQTALTNGWVLRINGVDTLVATQNRQLAQYMFDMQGVKIFGKEDRTMVGRFSFNKITDGADGVTITEGESIETVVRDDLTGLVYLETMVQGVYKDA